MLRLLTPAALSIALALPAHAETRAPVIVPAQPYGAPVFGGQTPFGRLDDGIDNRELGAIVAGLAAIYLLDRALDDDDDRPPRDDAQAQRPADAPRRPEATTHPATRGAARTLPSRCLTRFGGPNGTARLWRPGCLARMGAPALPARCHATVPDRSGGHVTGYRARCVERETGLRPDWR
ncbi:MAG: hypothetical protein ACU0BF_08790 [Paracoccaceae bacterium]